MWIRTRTGNFISRHAGKVEECGKFKEFISVLMIFLALLLATSASAEVIINSPSRRNNRQRNRNHQGLRQ
jgi:hypothetical protein